MFEYIENLRGKPDSHKKSIAFFTSAGITFVIFALWLVTLQVGKVSNDTVVVNKKTESPFKAVTENVAGVIHSITESRETFKKIINNETTVNVEVVPGK
jgi:hypothetical protein